MWTQIDCLFYRWLHCKPVADTIRTVLISKVSWFMSGAGVSIDEVEGLLEISCVVMYLCWRHLWVVSLIVDVENTIIPSDKAEFFLEVLSPEWTFVVWICILGGTGEGLSTPRISDAEQSVTIFCHDCTKNCIDVSLYNPTCWRVRIVLITRCWTWDHVSIF